MPTYQNVVPPISIAQGDRHAVRPAGAPPPAPAGILQGTDPFAHISTEKVAHPKESAWQCASDKLYYVNY